LSLFFFLPERMPACITPAIGLGRGITSYLPHCELDARLKQAMNAPTDSEYRKQLQRDPLKVGAAVRDTIDFFPYWPITPCPPPPYQ